MKTPKPCSHELRNIKTAKGFMKNSFIGLFVIMLVAFSHYSNAQKAQKADQLIKDLAASSQPALVEQGKQLNQLLNESNPTLFVYNGELTSRGGATPTVLNVHANSVSDLFKAHSEFRNIQLIRININSPEDLNLVLDFSKLSQFDSLLSIHFQFTYEACSGVIEDDCYNNLISNMLSGDSQNVNILYSPGLIM